MDIKEMKTFVTVVRFGSFSKAAENLGYTQAAVTIQIKNIEKDLGIKLFDRLGKKINLTNYGEIFHGHAIKILNGVLEAREAVSLDVKICGSLSIGAIDSLCSASLPNIITDFHKNYNEVSFKICNDTPSVLLEKLSGNELDIVYILDEKIINTNYIKVLDAEEEIVFVCGASHFLAYKEKVSVDNLLNFSFILTESDASYRKILESELAKLGKNITPLMESQSTELLCQLIINNMGVSFVPKFLIKNYLETNQMKIINVPEINIRLYRQVMYHKDKWVTREMKALFDMII